MDDEVALILRECPEFVPAYLALVHEADGEPGAAAVLAEFADYVADLAGTVERSLPLLERCLVGVEKLARSSEDAEDLVVWSFFDALSADDVRRVEPWLGRQTRALVDDADRSGTFR